MCCMRPPLARTSSQPSSSFILNVSLKKVHLSPVLFSSPSGSKCISCVWHRRPELRETHARSAIGADWSVCAWERDGKAQGGCDFLFFSYVWELCAALTRQWISSQASAMWKTICIIYSASAVPESVSVWVWSVALQSCHHCVSVCVCMLCKQCFESCVPTCLGLLSWEDARYCHIPPFKVCTQRQSYQAEAHWLKSLWRRWLDSKKSDKDSLTHKHTHPHPHTTRNQTGPRTSRLSSQKPGQL